MITECMQFCIGFVPINLATGANPGDWIKMTDYNRLAIVLIKAAGTAGEDPVLTLEQATSVAGAGAKALNFDRIDIKQGADLLAIGEFTTTMQTPANTYTNLTLAEEQAIIVIDVKAHDLDVNNNFNCVRLSVSDVGAAAQLGTLIYIPYEARKKQKPLPTAIA